MAYSKIKIYRKIIEAFNDQETGKDITSIVDLLNVLPISSRTFYNWELHEMQSIKRKLENNIVWIKRNLRSKWFKSDNPTLQIALYKLIGTPEEYHALANTKHDILSGNKPLQQNIDLDKELIKKIVDKL